MGSLTGIFSWMISRMVRDEASTVGTPPWGFVLGRRIFPQCFWGGIFSRKDVTISPNCLPRAVRLASSRSAVGIGFPGTQDINIQPPCSGLSTPVSASREHVAVLCEAVQAATRPSSDQAMARGEGIFGQYFWRIWRQETSL